MKPEIKHRLKRSLILAVIAVLIGAAIGYFQARQESGPARVIQKPAQQTAMPGVKIGGPYELVDHTGKAVTDRNFAGKYKLIYFGFTYCPAICPTELQKISKVLNMMEEEASNIQPLFITVDPERDTPAVMKNYVGLFHPRLIGLTGSRAQIDDVLKSYRVFAKKVQDPDMNDYTMDHSSYIYLMSPEDKLLTMYRIQDKADFIIRDIRARLAPAS